MIATTDDFVKTEDEPKDTSEIIHSENTEVDIVEEKTTPSVKAPVKDRAVKDFNTKELLDILKNANDDDELDDTSDMGYAQKILYVMMPTPDNLADMAASGTVTHATSSNETILRVYFCRYGAWIARRISEEQF